MVQKIIPNLWFDGVALSAASYYTKLFPKSRVTNITYYPHEGLHDFQQPLAGEPLTVEFTLTGMDFLAINAGPEFSPNPAASIMVNFDPLTDPLAEEHLDDLWFKLSFEGEVVMDLGEYPFSSKYGWVRDRYGYSWQLILTNPEGDPRPPLIPSLQFGGPHQDQARAAMEYYVEVFEGARLGTVVPYPQRTGPAEPGAVMFGEFEAFGQWFTATDSAVERDFTFNESFSFQVSCADQQEIDYLWAALSAVPEAEECGWCKDQFGVSWQIVPQNMEQLMMRPGAYQKLLGMKKLVIEQF